VSSGPEPEALHLVTKLQTAVPSSPVHISPDQGPDSLPGKACQTAWIGVSNLAIFWTFPVMEAREPPLYLEWPTLVHASGKIKLN